MTMDTEQLKDTHRVASPSTATPHESSQVARLDWVPSPPSPAVSGSSLPVTAGRLVGAVRGAVRLKLKVAVGTRQWLRWAVAFPWLDQSPGDLPPLIIERHDRGSNVRDCAFFPP